MINDDLHNINTVFLPHVVAALTISSVCFSSIELLQACLFEWISLAKLKTILNEENNNELQLYKKIYSIDCDFNTSTIINNWKRFILTALVALEKVTQQYIAIAYCIIFVGSILLPLYKPIIKYSYEGWTLISFGLFIATFAIRETSQFAQRNIKNQIWFNYYKNKVEKQQEEI